MTRSRPPRGHAQVLRVTRRWSKRLEICNRESKKCDMLYISAFHILLHVMKCNGNKECAAFSFKYIISVDSMNSLYDGYL